MLRKLKSLIMLSALVLVASPAWALTLNDIDFSSLSGDRTQVVLSFDGEPPEASGYTIEQPARIALDLSGVASGLEQRYHNLGSGNAQSMTVVEAGDRTRLIFNLSSLVVYDTRIDGNRLIVTIGGEDQGQQRAAAAPSASAPSAGSGESVPAAVSGESQAVAGAPVATAGDLRLVDVDFRRSSEGRGEVLIDFSSARVNVDMSERAGRIRLEIPGAQLPAELRRRLDVTDFATPVRRIDTFQEDGMTVIEIRPEGTYDYVAYQTDRRFTLSVEELTEDEAEQRQEQRFPYSGEKLSLNFQDIEVRSVLQLIADFTGLNLVASDTVSGRITLRLQNVPWDQALDLVLQTKGLDKRQVGNVLLVGPAQEIAEYERQELENKRQIAELAPVRLDIIQVNYAKAGDIVAMLQRDEELVSSRGFVSSDERTNTISVRETSDKLEQIRRLVTTWDIPVRQVLIEARIVRASTDVSRSLGVAWGVSGNRTSGSNSFAVGGRRGGLNNVGDFPTDMNVDLGVTGQGTSAAAIGFRRNNFLLDLELTALESDGRAEIVSQPKVVTADRQTASIKSGEEIPFQEAASSGATTVEFKEAALSLEVTPQITPDDNIIMDLRVNQDSRGQVTAGVPSIETNEVETQVLVGNGETVVLGGIFQSEKARTTLKTPFLGDIPYLGRLFTRTEIIDERSELLIFVTPKIMESNLLNQ
ncbi:MAG: type IV pilus secretin PilQ [Halomonadaceae bacterium]|nr:MAG: type IV pilus secretin PilQ [Halomonadaceae bacterium]